MFGYIGILNENESSSMMCQSTQQNLLYSALHKKENNIEEN